MKIKSGVSLAGIRPEMVVGLMIIKEIFDERLFPMTITSVTDSKHGFGSLHYVGQAVDIRTRHIPNDQITLLANLCREALGKQFDVVKEATHLHVEFQPK